MFNGNIGLNQERVQDLERLLLTAWEQKQFAGAAWAIVRHGNLAANGVLGTEGIGDDLPITDETLFDLASLTKPVATASTALCLIDRGEMLLGDDVRRYFPEAAPHWTDVTLRHLLTHTSGLPPYAPLYETRRGGEAIRDGILELEMKAAPGEKYAYSCLGYILMQHVIQAITGESLAKVASDLVFEPLGMGSTGYCPDPDGPARIASAGRCPHRDKALHGEVHDPVAWGAGGVSGNAGLFAPLQDVCKFGAALLDRGASSIGRVFSPAAANLMLTNQIDPAVGGHSIGLFTFPNLMLPRGDLLPRSSVGHTGFTGTSLVLAPELDCGAVLLTNCLVHSSDKGAFFRTRRRFHTLVGAAIGA
ncbi:MAG TPA: serine hydrolase domain-containing protein [Armatimonadota bacterium]|nr:serine hydrolase domain-containing protein [Armatimonadota bacterium]